MVCVYMWVSGINGDNEKLELVARLALLPRMPPHAYIERAKAGRHPVSKRQS